MKSSMIALTLFAAGANAACTTADTTAMTECAKKVTDEMIKTPPTKDTICKLYQDTMACDPACYCDDAAYKDSIASAEKTLQDAVKAMDGGDCTLTCGSGEAEIEDCDTDVKEIYFFFIIFFLLKNLYTPT